VRDEESNDLAGYFGDDPGDPVIVPAGSIACFSTTLFHRSGPNITDRMRRVYVAQYSAEPILSEDGSQPRMLAEPLLVAGKRVSCAGVLRARPPGRAAFPSPRRSSPSTGNREGIRGYRDDRLRRCPSARIDRAQSCRIPCERRFAGRAC